MNIYKIFDEIFEGNEYDNNRVAKLEKLRREKEPDMSLPGLKRYCEGVGRYRKLIIETSDSQIAAKMFLRANGISGIKEIRVIKCQPASNEAPKPSENVERLQKPSQDVIQESQSHVSLPSQRPKSKEVVVKKGISDEERERRRVRMKKMWKEKKAKKYSGSLPVSVGKGPILASYQPS